jgi:hypothetical protein
MKKNKLSNSQNPLSGKVPFDHTSNIRAGLYVWVVNQSRSLGFWLSHTVLEVIWSCKLQKVHFHFTRI